jgi:hypothetical protein
MNAETAIEKALEHSEPQQRWNWIVALEPGRRNVVLDRFVIVRQVGTKTPLEQRGQIHEARLRVSRRARHRSDRFPGLGGELAGVARSL